MIVKNMENSRFLLVELVLLIIVKVMCGEVKKIKSVKMK